MQVTWNAVNSAKCKEGYLRRSNKKGRTMWVQTIGQWPVPSAWWPQLETARTTNG
jgi:hypothetical protein